MLNIFLLQLLSQKKVDDMGFTSQSNIYVIFCSKPQDIFIDVRKLIFKGSKMRNEPHARLNVSVSTSKESICV